MKKEKAGFIRYFYFSRKNKNVKQILDKCILMFYYMLNSAYKHKIIFKYGFSIILRRDNMSDCCGNERKTLIMACAGAADVGFISDRVARMLAVAGKGSMYCLAGIGANMDGFIKGAKESGRNIVIDGCQVKCGKKILDNNGLNCESYVITDFGFKKGETGSSEDIIKSAFLKVQETCDKTVPPENPGNQKAGSCGCQGGC
jgi:uncharacterized metal-binding protein